MNRKRHLKKIKNPDDLTTIHPHAAGLDTSASSVQASAHARFGSACRPKALKRMCASSAHSRLIYTPWLIGLWLAVLRRWPWNPLACI